MRVELTPPNDWALVEDLSKWSFKLDEPGQAPEWWESKKDKCRARMEKEVSAMFVRDARTILLGGTWILLSGAVVERAVNCRIAAMLGDSRIKLTQRFVSIGSMRDSVQIESMGGSAQIGSMGGSARIESMRDSAQIESMWGSARIESMGGSARIESMGGSAQIGSMWDNAQAPSAPQTDNRVKPEVKA